MESIERLKGYVERIVEPSKNFAQKMRDFAKTHHQLVWDLWPLNGTRSAPGLVKLRDRLAHSGSMGVQHQAMAVATWHLSVLAERVALNLLGVDVAETQVSTTALRGEEWHSMDYWTALQRTALSKDRPGH